MPLTRRVPKFGFTPHNRSEVQIVNVETLGILVEKKKLAGGVVTPEILYKTGAIAKKNVAVKILGDGDLKVKLEVTAHAFSKSALTKIEAAGGKATILTNNDCEIMSKLTETFTNIFKIQELRERLLFTTLLLVIVRIGSHITVPGVDAVLLADISRNHPRIIFSDYSIYLLAVRLAMLQFLHLVLCHTSAHLLLYSFSAPWYLILPNFKRKAKKGVKKLRNTHVMGQLLFH